MKGNLILWLIWLDSAIRYNLTIWRFNELSSAVRHVFRRDVCRLVFSPPNASVFLYSFQHLSKASFLRCFRKTIPFLGLLSKPASANHLYPKPFGVFCFPFSTFRKRAFFGASGKQIRFWDCSLSLPPPKAAAGLARDPLRGASKQSAQTLRVFLFSFQHLSKARFLRCFRKTKIPLSRDLGRLFWRRKRDSNPRNRGYSSTVFKTAAFDRSAISPPQR